MGGERLISPLHEPISGGAEITFLSAECAGALPDCRLMDCPQQLFIGTEWRPCYRQFVGRKQLIVDEVPKLGPIGNNTTNLVGS